MTSQLGVTQHTNTIEGLKRWAVTLAWLTVVWNLVEAVVALTAGAAADSSALIGFGLDSTIEVSSASIVLWQFRATIPETREHLALRFIAISFFALALWVGASAISDLAQRSEPQASTVGIALAAVSLAVMPILAIAKQRVGRAMGAAVVIADSAQTWLCTSLSAVLLLGLGANALAGWWWADPIAGLAIAGVATREGIEAWQGHNCCATPEAPSACGNDDACT
ncbi:MAG: cation transporter [Actinomycetia bacterium]|nr:cation transporter [Actinomycetes bacterium]MCP4958781.1 cation transporter [Actinomycetes bacterium]